jgi:hypothetical protein
MVSFVETLERVLDQPFSILVAHRPLSHTSPPPPRQDRFSLHAVADASVPALRKDGRASAILLAQTRRRNQRQHGREWRGDRRS